MSKEKRKVTVKLPSGKKKKVSVSKKVLKEKQERELELLRIETRKKQLPVLKKLLKDIILKNIDKLQEAISSYYSESSIELFEESRSDYYDEDYEYEVDALSDPIYDTYRKDMSLDMINIIEEKLKEEIKENDLLKNINYSNVSSIAGNFMFDMLVDMFDADDREFERDVDKDEIARKLDSLLTISELKEKA